MQNQEQAQNLDEIRTLLSHLHGEVAALGASYSEVLLVLKSFEKTANVDDLTGCLRRKAFFAKWDELLVKCQSLGEGCGVLMIDIDHFKKVNDTYGHATGDEVIKRVADLLKQYESPDCVVGRLGGEEFAVVVRGSEAETKGLAEFIRRGAERLEGEVVGEIARGDAPVALAGADSEPYPVAADGGSTYQPILGFAAARAARRKWKCTVSVGLAVSPADLAEPQKMLQAADEALYQAKRAGRNRVQAA